MDNRRKSSRNARKEKLPNKVRPSARARSVTVTVPTKPEVVMIHDIKQDMKGERLATAAGDGIIRVHTVDNPWKPGYTHLTAELEGHRGAVWRVDWAHPKFGNLIASCSFDKKVMIWKETVLIDNVNHNKSGASPLLTPPTTPKCSNWPNAGRSGLGGQKPDKHGGHRGRDGQSVHDINNLQEDLLVGWHPPSPAPSVNDSDSGRSGQTSPFQPVPRQNIANISRERNNNWSTRYYNEGHSESRSNPSTAFRNIQNPTVIKQGNVRTEPRQQHQRQETYNSRPGSGRTSPLVALTGAGVNERNAGRNCHSCPVETPNSQHLSAFYRPDVNRSSASGTNTSQGPVNVANSSNSLNDSIKNLKINKENTKWECVYVCEGFRDSVNAVQWAPEKFGCVVACGSSDGSWCTLTLDLKTKSWSVCRTPDAHKNGVTSLSWCRYVWENGPLQPKRVVTGGNDMLLKIWKYTEDKWTEEITLYGHSDWIRDIDWSQWDGDDNDDFHFKIASCSQDNRVLVWHCYDKDDMTTWNNEVVSKFDSDVWTVSWTIGSSLQISVGTDQVTIWESCGSDKWERQAVLTA